MDKFSTIELNNGVKMPCIGIGPGGIGWNRTTSSHASISFFDKVYNKILHFLDKRHYASSVENAIKLGYRLIDYSFAYGNGDVLIDAIKKSGVKREEMFLTSRVTNQQQYEGNVRDEFLKNLDKLGLEYIDLLMFHWPVTDHFVETYKEMEKLYKEGYVKVLGVANCHQHHLQQLFDNCEIVPAINQIEIHPLFTQKPLVEFCHQHNIAVQAYTPLARNDDRLAKNPILQNLAKKYHKSIQQIILRWDVQLEQIPVPRSLNPNRQRQNIDIFDFSLTEEDVKAIDSININSRLRFDPDNLDFHSVG